MNTAWSKARILSKSAPPESTAEHSQASGAFSCALSNLRLDVFFRFGTFQVRKKGTNEWMEVHVAMEVCHVLRDRRGLRPSDKCRRTQNYETKVLISDRNSSCNVFIANLRCKQFSFFSWFVHIPIYWKRLKYQSIHPSFMQSWASVLPPPSSSRLVGNWHEPGLIMQILKNPM